MGRSSTSTHGHSSASKRASFEWSDTSSTAESGLSTETLPLNFGNVDLIGRQQEVEELQAAYGRIRGADSSSEMILVREESGVGKTQLIQHALESFVEHRFGFYCSGKFDQYESVSRPYGVVSDIVTELSTILAAREDLDECRERLETAFTNDERKLLWRFIPAIGDILGEGIESCAEEPMSEFAYRRFALVLRTFLGVVATERAPVVVFFDDIQWADAGSRDLVSRLAKGKSTNVLFVVAVRDDDERTFEIDARETSISLRTLRVGALREPDINVVVANLLEQSPERTLALSHVVYQRTRGNIYSVVQFLERLHRERYVQFSFGTSQWEWNLEQIQQQTRFSENVAILLAGKIGRLSEDVQRILMVGACLGFSFSSATLREICLFQGDLWTTSECSSSTELSDKYNGGVMIDGLGFFERSFENSLARKLGLVERLPGDRHRFSHDRVQQSLISMISSGQEGLQLYRRLGTVIRDSYNSPPAQEWKLFTIVDLLDKGRYWEQDDTCAADFAGLCLEAASTALHKSAFLSAGTYADKAIGVVNRAGHGRKEQYDMCLELYALSARTHYSYGDFKRCKECTDMILEHGKTGRDKHQARYIRIALLAANREGMVEAVKESIRLCRELGLRLKLHPSKLDILVIFWKTKRLLRGRTAEALWGLPVMEDESVLEMMRILSAVVFYSFQARLREHLYIANVTMMYLTLKIRHMSLQPCWTDCVRGAAGSLW